MCVKDIPFICIIEGIFPCSSIVFFQFQHRQVLVAGAGCSEGAEYRPEALVRRRRLGAASGWGMAAFTYLYICVCLFSCYIYILYIVYCILYMYAVYVFDFMVSWHSLIMSSPLYFTHLNAQKHVGTYGKTMEYPAC